MEIKKSESKDKWQTKLIVVLVFVCVISLISATVFAVKLINSNSEPKITSTAISQKLSQISELASTKLEYRDISHYEKGDIAFITKKSFNVIYNATVKVGIDLNDVKVNVIDNKIEIDLPKSKILDININPDSIEFYDEKAALFNWENRTDTVEILKKAREEIEKKVMEQDILSESDKNVKSLISGFLSPIAESDKEKMEIVFKSH